MKKSFGLLASEPIRVYHYWMRYLALIALACACATPAIAQDAAVLVGRIDSLYHASPNWRVEFDQIVRYPIFDETEKESGTLEVGPAGRFRLTTDRHVIVSDGDTLWTHNKRANQVVVDRVDDAGEAVRPVDFLFHFKEDYVKQLCDHEGPGQCLYMKTTEETAFIREMWLWVDVKTAHVRRAVYKDVNANETTFSFRKIDFAYKPKPGTFSYETPPGVEVVRMP